VLGNDAAVAIAAHLGDAYEKFARREPVARSADFAATAD
jgi:hypothetical protein